MTGLQQQGYNNRATTTELQRQGLQGLHPDIPPRGLEYADPSTSLAWNLRQT